MTKVILVRHGQSMGNLYSLFLGHTDLGLSPLGKQQAEKVADYLAAWPIDKIYSSDLIRAEDTVRPLAERKKLEIIPVQDLREIYAGEWEKRSYDELSELYPEAYAIFRNDIGRAVPTGGESVLWLSRRVYRAFDRIVAENDGKTVVIATHATPIRLLSCRFLGRDPAFAGTVRCVPNASVTVVDVDAGHYTVEQTGYDAFLGDNASAFPGNI